MITVLNLIMSFVAVAGWGGCGCDDPPHVWVERRAYVMGTVLEARVAAPTRELGVGALEAAFAEVRRLDGLLSSWRADSEVGRLNATPAGEATEVSPELLEILREVVVWSDSTGHAFDPAVGALIDAWDLRGEGRRPAPAELRAALAASGMDLYRIDGRLRQATRLAPGVWLDSGGFGKGAALRAAEQVLRERGAAAAYLDFGGQVLVFGRSPAAGGEWEIAIAHPTRRREVVSSIRVHTGSVATSAQSERFVDVEGERLGHVLDPRTGLPVAGGASVTVVAEDAMVADVLATALLVMGPEAGGRWAADLHDTGVLWVVERDGRVQESWNTAFERYRVQPISDG